MGVTVAFCDRFRIEEWKNSSSKLSRDLDFEYVGRLQNHARLGLGKQSSFHAVRFAHIGDALKGFFDDQKKKSPGDLLQGFGNVALEVVKRTEVFLGVRNRPLNVELSSWTPAKGETIAVLVSIPPQRSFVDAIAHFVFRKKNAGPEAKVQVLYDGSEIPALRTAADRQLLRALVPTTPLTTPGPRTLKVEFTDGRHEVYEGSVEVMEKEYPVESIWLPKTKSKIRGTVMEKQKVGAFLGTLSEEQIWSGPFILPSDGEITTGYGLQRYYNGVFANHYFHRGVDYGAWEGDPVKAPASGRVMLVGKESDGYEIHGNCVGLDHGHGVTSLMMHLNSSFVKEGEMVQAGQIIGTVGETGIATGPHLHWGFHVRGEAVDPHPWMQEQKWV